MSHAQQDFEKQRQAVMVSPATQPEPVILDLLQAGIDEHKPTQAAAVAERWLRENVAEDPLLLFHAAKASERSGGWQSAAALYRQYLQRADLKSPQASEAVLAVYTLLINQLDDIESAYAFANSVGHRLSPNAQARQFDRWFLDEAKRRKDVAAVAQRLHALTRAGVDDDLLVALYEPDLRWLLSAINDGRLDQQPYDAGMVDTVKALAAAIDYDRELGLLLDWSVSVKAYNMAVLAGEQAVPPIAEAEALLRAYPRYAELVQTGWAGSRGRHYRGDHKLYWTRDLEAKLAPVNRAVGKLDPLDRAAFYRSWGYRYYDGGPQLLTAEKARAWVLANPELANHKGAPVLIFNWHAITLEDAKALAPHLAQNPSPEAAGIRAIASVKSSEAEELNATVEALIKQEAWRLSPNELPGYIDRLWHRAGRPDGNARRDQLINLGRQAAETIKKDAVKKDDNAQKRLAAFKALWQDYRSPQPKQVSVRPRLLQVLSFTPEALPHLLADESPEARRLLRETLQAGVTSDKPAWKNYESARQIHTDRYSPAFNELVRRHYGGLQRLVRDQDKYKPHPLAPVFHDLLDRQLSNNTVQPWVMFAWLNTQFPEDNAESIALMRRLVQSPAWAALPFEARAGARLWFGTSAMSPEQTAYADAADIDLICKPLLELTEDADAKAAASALRQVLDGLQRSPVRHEIVGLDRLSRLPAEVLAEPQVFKLLLKLVGPMRSFQADPRLGEQLLAVVAREPDAAVIHETAAYLWRHTEVYHRTLPRIIELAESLAEVHPSAAQTVARIGLQTIDRHKRGHTYYKRETDIPRLNGARGKAMLAMGLIEIPVPPSDPAYGVYRSQAEFVIGNRDSARELYTEHADHLPLIHRDLSIAYLLWALQAAIDERDESRQEALAKAMLEWMQQSPGAFTPEQRVALEIAYGDIALQRGLLPEAQQIFTRISRNPEYAAVFARHTATLRRVLVQRVSGDYDGALQTLMQLDAEKVPRLITAAHYARAEVYYAMEEYRDAGDEIEKVLERDPDHADATILRGRVQLKLQRLIEATEVELGSVAAQASIVPGEVLKVTLNDPTLTVSSGASDIEVVVWATSGDKEYLLLRQFGDEKTKYRGDVRTALGKPVPDDGTLQIVGNDEIFYAYSERFREKMVNLAENRGGPITVASDAIIMASARRLLSENEQRAADMRAVTEVVAKRYYRSIANMDPETIAQLKAEAEARSRRAMLAARVKPGSPIYLRVVDPDRGRTAGVDELAVSVASSSGDQVSRVILRETGDYSGVFEGQVETAEAQALAFGSTSETGRNPNMVISPNSDYPAWRPVNTPGEPHRFTVDLNDNAPIDRMNVIADDEGYALKRFLVQTAMNQNAWTTVASYPASEMSVQDPWRPSIAMVIEEGLRAPRGARSVYEDLHALREHMASGWLAAPEMALAKNVTGPSMMLDAPVRTDKPWSWQGRDNNPAVVYRFQAYFYEPASVTRRFAIDLGKHDYKPKNNKKSQAPEFLIAVNGRPITGKDHKQLEGAINLGPGVHKLEVWATGWVDAMGFGRSVRLRANLDDPEQLVDCPDAFFDPVNFPEGTRDYRNAPAKIEAEQGGKAFAVTFAEGSRARLVRLVFIDQQGPVPSINAIKLIGPGDRQLLPVAEDYAEQRKNDLLEIVTGDRVTVRYVDDRYVTSGRQKHERFLDVAYSDAKIRFADIEPRFSEQRQQHVPYDERLLRFAHGKPLPIVVTDADMDVSIEPDTLAVTIQSSNGESRELTATETGPSTGVFRAWVTPVLVATEKPESLQVPVGGELTAIYRDAENLQPGVPYERLVSIQHAAFAEPRIELAHATITDYEPENPANGRPLVHIAPLNERIERLGVPRAAELRERFNDRIRTRYRIDYAMHSSDSAPEGGLAVVHGRLATIDIVAPHLALGSASSIPVYIQSDAGRAALGNGSAGFNPNAPGTLVYTASLGKRQDPRVLERGGFVVGYNHDRGTDYEQQRRSLEQGRFRLSVPVIPAPLPEQSYADREAVRGARLPQPVGLAARAGERIHIAVPYKDEQGRQRWATASATVVTRPILDAMEEDYRTTKPEAYVGEKLYLRVVDTAADTTGERDTVRVYMAAKSGAKHFVNLTETDPHSGVFKGVYTLTYAEAAEVQADDASYDVRLRGFPVIYGDTVGLRYTDRSDRSTPVQFITIAKGSDGTIAPFSKRYNDPETAMQTQFAMAESHLELARRYRQLGETELADRGFARAKQLLQNAITQFNDPETRAHAEYLLGNLTLEDADATEDKDLRQQRYQAALARYMKVTGTYPDTQFASKAQFQTAVVYERLDEPDIAAQEYVKLAYKYPESEHLATAMARLGTHFQRKAVGFDRQAKPLLADPEDKDAMFEGEVLQRLARAEYVKAAQIFERLQERFPSDDLAGKAGLRAGQIYMRAEDYRAAIKALQAIIDNESYDGATLRAEAMYWAGMSQQQLNQSLLAYALFKRITYDFPESKWAAYARSQLSSERMLRLDQQLEIERLEEGR